MTIKGIAYGVRPETSAYPFWRTNIIGSSFPAGSYAEPSGFFGTEQVKFDIVPVMFTQATPKIVILISLG